MSDFKSFSHNLYGEITFTFLSFWGAVHIASSDMVSFLIGYAPLLAAFSTLCASIFWVYKGTKYVYRKLVPDPDELTSQEKEAMRELFQKLSDKFGDEE